MEERIEFIASFTKDDFNGLVSMMNLMDGETIESEDANGLWRELINAPVDLAAIRKQKEVTEQANQIRLGVLVLCLMYAASKGKDKALSEIVNKLND